MRALPLMRIGNVYTAQGNYQQALDKYRESLAVASDQLGEYHPLVGDILIGKKNHGKPGSYYRYVEPGNMICNQEFTVNINLSAIINVYPEYPDDSPVPPSRHNSNCPPWNKNSQNSN